MVVVVVSTSISKPKLNGIHAVVWNHYGQIKMSSAIVWSGQQSVFFVQNTDENIFHFTSLQNASVNNITIDVTTVQK